MSEHDWIKEFPAAVTVCDAEGVILEMNDKAAKTFESDGGYALVGEKDVLIRVEDLCKSAAHYKADLVVVPDSAHNLMMEKSYQETDRTINTWLNQKQIA